MSSRSIVLSGDVSSAMFSDLCHQLDELEYDDDSAPVIVRINSNGGNTADALAIAGRLKSSPCQVITEGFGHIMSAATLILAAGEHRRMSRFAWFMIHDAKDRFGGTTADIKHSVKQLEREELQWIELMETFTGVPKALWADLTAKSTYLTAEDCKKLTIVDELI